MNVDEETTSSKRARRSLFLLVRVRVLQQCLDAFCDDVYYSKGTIAKPLNVNPSGKPGYFI